MNAELLSTQSEGEAVNHFPRLLLNLTFTATLLGVLIFEALRLGPAISGKPQGPTASMLIATLLPIGTLLLLSLVERIVPPAGPRKSLGSWLLHLQLNIFYSIMGGIATVTAIIASSAVTRHLGFSLGLIDLRIYHGQGPLVLVASVWVSAVAGDFFFYWYHRLLHESAFFWQHHKMHHMDPELDAVTLARQNWIDVLIAAILITIPLVIVFKLDSLDPWELGVSGGAIAAGFGTFLTLGHLNVRLQVGKVGSLFYCSPQMHRIHHSCLPEHRDKNFAFVFPLWDVLFGTYYSPSWNEFPPTGVEGEKEIQSFWEAQIFTPREWLKMFRARRDRRIVSGVPLPPHQS